MPFKSIPKEELDHVAVVVRSLSDLKGYVQNFADALALYEFSQQNQGRQLTGWMGIAGRDAALTVFHFGNTMQGIGRAFKDCPTFRAAIEHSRLREARRMFEKSFPDYIAIRNAVAHAGELHTSVEKSEANMARAAEFRGLYIGQNARIIIQGFINDSFLQNINGRLVALELSEASLEALAAAADLFTSGFPADPKWMRRLLWLRRSEA